MVGVSEESGPWRLLSLPLLLENLQTFVLPDVFFPESELLMSGCQMEIDELVCQSEHPSVHVWSCSCRLCVCVCENVHQSTGILFLPAELRGMNVSVLQVCQARARARAH